MVHIVGFRDGKAFYRNRFVRTDGFAGRERGRRPAVAGAGRAGADGQARLRLGRTNVDEGRVQHRRHRAPRHRADQLLPVRRPVPRRPVHRRDTLGKEDWNGALSRSTGAFRRIRRSTTATGELLFFNYSKQAPYMRYGVVDAHNDLVHYTDIPLPGPRLPHDMAFTAELRHPQRLSVVLGSQAARGRHPPAGLPPRTCRRGSPSSPAAAGPTTSGGSRPTRRSCCTSPTPTRTATRSCSTASSRATLARSIASPATSGRRLSVPGPGPAADPAAPLAVQPRHRRDDAKSN